MPLYAGLPDYLDRVLRTWPFYYFLGALLPALVFGVPAFMLLRKLLRLSAVNCVLVGAIVAALPWFLLGLLAGGGEASTGGRATITDGHYTAFGWLEFGAFLGMMALAGAVGGMIFWLIAAARLPRRRAS